MKTRTQFSENRIRITRTIIYTMLLGSFLALSSCQKDDTMTTTEIAGDMKGSTTAPAFELKTLGGSTVKLADFKNKVVVLFFFGNTCPSCQAAAPNIQSMLQGTFGSNTGFMMLGLDQWDGNEASVESFKKSTGVTFPLLLMASPTAKAYSTTYDRLVVIDKSGNIMFDGKQGAASDLAAVKAKVEMLLK